MAGGRGQRVGVALPQEVPLPACPRCARVLPPFAGDRCVHCGASLASRFPAQLSGSAGSPPGGSRSSAGARSPLPPAQGPSRATALYATPRGAQDSLVGAVVGGRFQVEELIGQGGMGKVYRARHLTLDKPVCLKMLKPALLEDPT